MKLGYLEKSILIIGFVVFMSGAQCHHSPNDIQCHRGSYKGVTPYGCALQ